MEGGNGKAVYEREGVDLSGTRADDELVCDEVEGDVEVEVLGAKPTSSTLAST